MESLETNLGYLSLNETGQPITDLNYFCATQPRFVNNGATQHGFNIKRQYSKGYNYSNDQLSNTPYTNRWNNTNKVENVGIFGPPPVVNNGTADSTSNYSLGSSLPNRSQDQHWSNGSNKNSESDLFNEPPQNINAQAFDGIPVKQSGPNWTPIDPMDSFNDLELHQLLKDNIERAKYTHPTPVQKYAIPIISAKRDLMACAQTGSGKTAAFLLPILNSILKSKPEEKDEHIPCTTARPIALILAPTRELSCQIYDEARKFSYRSSIRPCVVYGGTPLLGQYNALSRGCNLLVATPGRLNHMINKNKIGLEDVKRSRSNVGYGFRASNPLHSRTTSNANSRATPNSYAFCYFSKRNTTVGRVGSTNENITQEVINVSEKDKADTLVRFLRDQDCYGRILVFVETKRGVDLLTQFLRQHQFPVSSIHGARQQSEREHALSSFRSGITPILIATAVAARGLDIPNVKHVVNYDLPSDIEEYVHRIGRTGRMGQPGSALSFYCDRNQNIVRDLIDLLRESKQTVPAWLDSCLSYASSADRRRAKTGYNGSGGGGTNRRNNATYGSLDYRHLSRNTSYVRVPMVPPHDAVGGANTSLANNYSLLGNCSMPFPPSARFTQPDMYKPNQAPPRMFFPGTGGNASYLTRPPNSFDPMTSGGGQAHMAALLQHQQQSAQQRTGTGPLLHPLLAFAAALQNGAPPSSAAPYAGHHHQQPAAAMSAPPTAFQQHHSVAAASHFHPAALLSATSNNSNVTAGHHHQVQPLMQSGRHDHQPSMSMHHLYHQQQHSQHPLSAGHHQMMAAPNSAAVTPPSSSVNWQPGAFQPSAIAGGAHMMQPSYYMHQQPQQPSSSGGRLSPTSIANLAAFNNVGGGSGELDSNGHAAGEGIPPQAAFKPNAVIQPTAMYRGGGNNGLVTATADGGANWWPNQSGPMVDVANAN